MTGTVVLEDILLGQKDDILLKARKIKASFLWRELLKGNIEIKALKGEDIYIAKIPQLAPSDSSQDPFKLPFKNIEVKNLTIAPQVLNSLGLTEYVPLYAQGLKIDGIYNDSGAFYVRLDNGAGAFTLDGRIELSSQHHLAGTRFKVTAENLAFLNKWVQVPTISPLELTIALSGYIKEPEAQIDLDIAKIVLDEFLLEALHVKLLCHYQNEGLQGSLTTDFQVAQQNIQAKTDFSYITDLILKDVDVDGFHSHWHTNLVDFSGNSPIVVKGTFSDLANLQTWLPLIIQGTATADLTIKNVNDLETSISLIASQCTVENCLIDELNIELTEVDLSNPTKGNLRATLQNAQAGNFFVEQVQLATVVNADFKNCPFEFSSKNATQLNLALASYGTWSYENERLSATIKQLHGSALQSTLTLQEPVFIEYAKNLISLSETTLAVDENLSHMSFQWNGENVQGHFEAQDWPLEKLLKFTDFPTITGLTALKAELAGTLQSPTLNLIVQAKELKIADKTFSKLAPGMGEAILNLNEQGLTANGQLLIFDTPPMMFSFYLPVYLSISPFEVIQKNEIPLQGSMQATGELGSILGFYFPNMSMLSGKVQGAISLSGTLNNPIFEGECHLSEGKFEIEEIGTVLNNLTAQIEIKDSIFNVTELSAIDKQNGTVTGSGKWIFNAEENYPFVLNLALNNVLVINQDYLKTQGTGSLIFRGDLTSAALEGEVSCDKGIFSIPEQAPSLMNYVDVTYINLPNNVTPPLTLLTKHSRWPLHFGIAVDMQKGVSIQGKDLSSEWKGNLKVEGSTDALALNGELKVIKGHYQFNGKQFAINQGNITFAGEPDKKTSLYVIANKDLGEVTVDIILKGPVKNPSISFRSNPPLSQREILSWLLFNRGSSEISSFQGAQLSESISNLGNSSQKGPDLLTKIRSSLGIDRIEFSRDDNSESGFGFQVGKYISDKVFVSINKSDVNRLAIEAALTDRIKLQAEVGDDAKGKMFLRWKRNY